MNASGLVYDDGAYRDDLLFQNPYFATGFPISEAYWATVRVGGTERTVLVQVFERRVLTYTPGNPPGWDVEAGNVGLHYYEWRYNSSAPPANPDPAPEPPSDGLPDVAVCLDQSENQLLALVNEYRATNGLGTLAVSASLNVAAFEHSQDMGIRGYFGIVDPDGLGSTDLVEAAGYAGYTVLGEYIAAGIVSPQATLDGWLASPAYGAGLLGEEYNVVGIGRVLVDGSEWGWYWTVLIGDYIDAAPSCG